MVVLGGGRVMANERSEAVVRQIQRLFGQGTVGGLDDVQLLERFVAGGEGVAGGGLGIPVGGAGGEGVADVAFESLVERHGPMVLRVCRDVLDDPHDAQDAFQATFLVLVRRVGTVRRRESLASWLYGVAVRVATRSRAASARRRSV